MADLIDDWIKRRSPLHPHKLHALGLITFLWNGCEVGLRDILTYLSGVHQGRAAWAVMHEMGGVTMAAAISELAVLTRPADDPARAAILHAMALHDVNRINRNQLTHFMPAKTEDGLEFWRVKGVQFNPQTVPSSTEKLRRVADDIWAFLWYLDAILRYLSAERRSQPPPTLPEKPPVPERLWRPPPPVRPKRTRQPRPSPG